MSHANFSPSPIDLPHSGEMPIPPSSAGYPMSLMPAWLSSGAEHPVVDREARGASNVLIVEDDECIGLLLSMVLTDAGFHVNLVQNAEDAFTAACAEQPALMLIDYMMPHGNGDTLICRLQAHDATRHISLALMSSARPRLAHMHGIPFLPKPFDNEDLLEFVRLHARVPATE